MRAPRLPASPHCSCTHTLPAAATFSSATSFCYLWAQFIHCCSLPAVNAAILQRCKYPRPARSTPSRAPLRACTARCTACCWSSTSGTHRSGTTCSTRWTPSPASVSAPTAGLACQTAPPPVTLGVDQLAGPAAATAAGAAADGNVLFKLGAHNRLPASSAPSCRCCREEGAVGDAVDRQQQLLCGAAGGIRVCGGHPLQRILLLNLLAQEAPAHARCVAGGWAGALQLAPGSGRLACPRWWRPGSQPAGRQADSLAAGHSQLAACAPLQASPSAMR